MDLTSLAPPPTPATELALEVSTRFSPTALVHHCRRSYLFAAAFGLQQGISFDAELLFVAAMLHDIGLTDAFDNHAVDFETAGGHVAWVFAAGAGWSPERRGRAALAIVDHMRDDVDPVVDPEGHLLAAATSLDISGRRPEAWTAEFRHAVVTEFPRLDLATRFLRCFEAQAARKPTSTAAESVRSGLARRLRSNLLEGLTDTAAGAAQEDGRPCGQ